MLGRQERGPRLDMNDAASPGTRSASRFERWDIVQNGARTSRRTMRHRPAWDPPAAPDDATSSGTCARTTPGDTTSSGARADRSGRCDIVQHARADDTGRCNIVRHARADRSGRCNIARHDVRTSLRAMRHRPARRPHLTPGDATSSGAGPSPPLARDCYMKLGVCRSERICACSGVKPAFSRRLDRFSCMVSCSSRNAS